MTEPQVAAPLANEETGNTPSAADPLAPLLRGLAGWAAFFAIVALAVLLLRLY